MCLAPSSKATCALRSIMHTSTTLISDGPLDASLTLSRVPIWGDASTNHIGATDFRRGTWVNGRHPFTYRISWIEKSNRFVVSLDTGTDDTQLSIATKEARAILGMEQRYPILLPLDCPPLIRSLASEFAGFRLPQAPDPFECLVSLVCAQQVATTVARRVRTRFVQMFGTPSSPGGPLAFPRPGDIAPIATSELRLLGFSERKADCIRKIAVAAEHGHFDAKKFADYADDEVVKVLTSVKGVGRWTAEWFLVYVLGRFSHCPISDAVVRKAILNYFPHTTVSDGGLESLATSWGDERAVVVAYLITAMKAGRVL